MNFELLIIFGVVYFVLSVISKAKRAATRQQEDEAAATRPFQRSSEVARPPVRNVNQGEATTLQRVLQEIERVRREAEQQSRAAAAAPERRPGQPKPLPEQGPLGRKARASRPTPPNEEGRSLEGPAIEAGRLRRERPALDQDAAGELVAERRIAAAEARNKELGDSDHAEFERKVREGEPATAVARRGYTTQQLRDAFIWQEILRPPLAIREE